MGYGGALTPRRAAPPQDPIFKGNKVTGTEVGYPGGRWFDPFNFAASPKAYAENKARVVQHQRLAAACCGLTQRFTRTHR